MHQIRVNSVCPLGCRPRSASTTKASGGGFAASLAKVPLGRSRATRKDDVGQHAVAFLLSDDARFVTGQTLMLDGGPTPA